MINSVAASGVLGMQRGLQQLERGAVAVARQGTGAPDAPSLTDGLLDAKLGQLQTQASAKVVQAADETLGTLIDLFA